jgi:DNA-binding protein YbaB
MMKRMEMLEQQLKALKEQMAAQSTASTAAAPAVKVKNGGSLTFGGYLKADYRHVDGDAAYFDYWLGSGSTADDTSHTKFNVRESRLNAKYQKNDVTAFVEVDFYGEGGDEKVSSSVAPRLRHAFIKNDNWLVGQTWSTFQPLMAIPEALDFGGPLVGQVFIRQSQIRYTNGGFSIALENPETSETGRTRDSSRGAGLGYSAGNVEEDTPDLIAAYKFSGDWGSAQVAALVRELDPVTAGFDEESAFGVSAGARFKVGDRDDLRVSATFGETGRYVGVGLTNDYTSTGEVEETTSFVVSYRHFWNNDWRTNVYYGQGETDEAENDRSHWGVNLIRTLSPGLTAGVEIGQVSIDDDGVDADSEYLQMSWKYAL